MKTDNEIELDSANKMIEELSRKLIIAGYQMGGLSEVNHDLITENKLLCQDADQHLMSERRWEVIMMDAIGEDGPGSVADAIKLLKEENKKALKIIKTMLKHYVEDPEGVIERAVTHPEVAYHMDYKIIQKALFG